MQCFIQSHFSSSSSSLHPQKSESASTNCTFMTVRAATELLTFCWCSLTSSGVRCCARLPLYLYAALRCFDQHSGSGWRLWVWWRWKGCVCQIYILAHGQTEPRLQSPKGTVSSRIENEAIAWFRQKLDVRQFTLDKFRLQSRTVRF